MSRTIETAIPLPMDRFTPSRQFGEMAKMLADSGVVDYQQPWDQLTSWWPNSLWNADNTPVANVVKDCDSWADVYALSAYAAAVTNHKLGAAISLDSIRHGPAELVQTMATMGNLTDGRSIFMIGGGEQKQCKPFGWKRAEGLKRMEDLFGIFHKLWECEGPIDYAGNHWTFEQAWIGSARQHRPRVWALGGGPKLLDLAARQADGFATMAPFVFVSPDHCAERIVELKNAVAEQGRNPESFDFGIFAAVLIHDDPAVIDRALDNPLFRFITATMGRINQNDWDLDGIAPPMPRDWSYAIKLLPTKLAQSDINDMIGQTTRTMSEKTWIYGSPGEVAAELKRYVEAGATWINVIDMLPLLLPLEEQAAALPRSIEVCRQLKQG